VFPTIEEDDTMSQTKEKVGGAVEELGGKIKKRFGHVIGSHRIEAEGRAEELEGKARREAAKAAERANQSK
jgi:uncharacterized protein YjbJ (UPF0337 family)